MRRYTRHASESALGEGTQWTEFGDDGWAIRQVETYAGRWFSSAIEHDPEIGGTLCDQPLSSLDLSESVDVTQDEFERVWAQAQRSLR